jgi:hypothetical protein
MSMLMLGRVLNNRRLTMRFMLIGQHESRLGVMVRAARMGAHRNGKRHTNAQHPKR